MSLDNPCLTILDLAELLAEDASMKKKKKKIVLSPLRNIGLKITHGLRVKEWLKST